MRKILLFLSFVVAVGVSHAQDVHYSQFYNSPLNVNPANTGIFNGDKRFTVSYRNQWSSVPVPWIQYSGSYDMKWYPKHGQKHFFSGGLFMNHDRQGDGGAITLTNVNLTGSWTKIINEQNLFTIGLLLGYSQRGWDETTLTWDRQWNDALNQVDPGASSGEILNTQRGSFIDNGIGLNYRWQKSRRTKMDIGLGVFHLIEPNTSILEAGSGGNEDIKLPRRISFTGVGAWQVAPKLDIQLDALYQLQGEYNEFVFGGLGKMHVNQRRGKETELHVGVGYRTSGSIFPIVALQFPRVYVSANYDANIKDFTDVNVGTDAIQSLKPSTFELHFNYIISDVRPLERVKVCPIF